jgi:hypothetical protein
MPEGLDAKFWDAQTGLKSGDLIKAYGELATKDTERAASIPENLEDYKAELPADFKLPEGAEFKIEDNDPLLPIARAWAKENGLSQEGFKGLLALRAKLAIEDQSAQDQQFAAHLEAEGKKLGENAKQRKEAVEAFLKSKLNKEKYEALRFDRTTSALAFEAIEDLISLATAQQVPSHQPGSGAPPAPQNVRPADRWYPEQKAS